MEGRIEESMQSKVVIVTGASRGIGANIVKTLAKKGYNVILNYNTSEKEAITVKQELEKNKAEFETDGNSFMHILVIEGNGKIDGRNAKKGDSFLIPANHEKFEISGEIEFLATTI